VTDAEGKFAFEGLDPELYFRLLVYERGFEPTYTDGYIDPRSGAVTVTLAPHDLAERDPELVLHGKIVDARGDPVARAVVSPQGQTLGQGAQFGGLEGVDDLALSDENGEFELGVAAKGEKLLLLVSARGFATRMTPWLPAGPEPSTIVLGRGVTVTGLVKKGEQPLAGVELGLAQVNRDGEHFVGERTIGTGPDGRFTFVNVAPNDAWTVYGLMSSLQKHGALAVRPVTTGADETTLDLGTLVLEPGLRLTGRVELSDKKPLPPDLRVMLGREEAWDSQVAILSADGRFAFEGLPRELYTLNVRLQGYVVSPRNQSHDALNRSGLLGRVEANTELVLLLEPGMEKHSFDASDLAEGAWGRYQALLEAPLRGAPAQQE
jgi:hypothetical protein